MSKQLVELCAGTAAVSFAALGAPPFPCSRIGSKQGYTVAILELMGIEPGSCTSAVLVEQDPELALVLQAMLRDHKRLPQRVERLLRAGTPREVWNRTKGRRDPGSLLVRMAGARGGVGGFRGEHKLRPTATGIPFALVRRLERFAEWASRWSGIVGGGGTGPLSRGDWVSVLLLDASDLLPGRHGPIDRDAVVYIDPPYVGRHGYGFELREPVEVIATRWARAGHHVWVSEARPLPGGEWHDITDRRRGQSRRSLTTSTREWLTHYRPQEVDFLPRHRRVLDAGPLSAGSMTPSR